MRYKSKQSGFSAVELLITLFIAAVFLISGFELYAAIIKNGGDARMMASASSVVTDYIQRYKSTATNPCTVQTPLTNSSITVFGLSNVYITVAIQCPYSSGTYSQGTTPNTVSEIIATVQYGTPQQTVSNATYISNPNSGLVTDGLVLNLDAGSADSYSGSGITWTDLSGSGNNGTLYNGVSYSSTNGGVLTFDGVNDYVGIPNSTSLNPVSNSFSVSMWFMMNAVGSVSNSILMNKENAYESSAGGGVFTYAWQPYWAWESGFTVSLGQWYNAVIVYDGTHQYVYENGTLVFSRPQTGNMVSNSSELDIGARGGGTQNYLPGRVGVAQIYNRALSPSEINQDYNALKSRYSL